MSVPPQRGSATVLGTVLVCVVTTAVFIGIAGAGMLVGQRRAAAAADLAALAGAASLRHGQPGCAAAHDIAVANDVRMQDCEVVGDTVAVTVAADVRTVFDLSLAVTARARAGPVP